MRYRFALAALMALPVSQTLAQTATICVNCESEFHAVAADAQVALNWITTIAQMKRDYDMFVDTYESLSHLNPRTMLTGQGLLNDATRLPGSLATAMPGLNFGQITSAPGGQFYNQNHYYTPQSNDWGAQELQRRQQATANIQGEAQTGLLRARSRLASLTELENSIPSQPDVQATAAMDSRINAEKMHLANEGNNIQQLQLMQQSQQAVDQQRAEQRSRQNSEQWGATVAQQAWGN